jgi:hypothetical protein
MDNFPRVIEVIESIVTRGTGESSVNPTRIVFQYHSRSGELLAERDEWLENHTINTAGLGQQ